jgi:hypothetical protein
MTDTDNTTKPRRLKRKRRSAAQRAQHAKDEQGVNGVLTVASGSRLRGRAVTAKSDVPGREVTCLSNSSGGRTSRGAGDYRPSGCRKPRSGLGALPWPAFRCPPRGLRASRTRLAVTAWRFWRDGSRSQGANRSLNRINGLVFMRMIRYLQSSAAPFRARGQ